MKDIFKVKAWNLTLNQLALQRGNRAGPARPG